MKPLPSSFPAVVKQRLSDVLVNKINDHIVQGGLNPGDRLPTEQEMARQFGVSRLAVREATKALGFLGIIDSSPRRGVTVGTDVFSRAIPLLRIHPSSRNITAEELTATRVIIETGSLPYVMRRIASDPNIYLRLEALNDRMRKLARAQDWIEYDMRFHNALLLESGLKSLVAFAELLQLFFNRFGSKVKTAEWRSGIEMHAQILKALQAQNLLHAAELLRTHVSVHTPVNSGHSLESPQ